MSEPRPDKNLAPEANFAFGLRTVEFPELGEKHSGKVRDWWNIDEDRIVFLTTDRQSAYDVVVGTIPGKGKALNETSAWWAKNTADIIPNDVIAIPHPNVKIARQAIEGLGVEMVYRRFNAKSSTSTSIYRNYTEGRRRIYGIDFPDGLEPNQPFPEDLGQDGIIFTPTTKAEQGEHDAEMTEEQARELIRDRFGSKIANQAVKAGYELFKRGENLLGRERLIFVDTKYEFGVDADGRLMLIDEIHTPDSSRIWKKDSYLQRLQEGLDPESFDKEILRRWLKDQGFTGETGQSAPIIPDEIRKAMLDAYVAPYRMLSGRDISSTSSQPQVIRGIIAFYLNGLIAN